MEFFFLFVFLSNICIHCLGLIPLHINTKVWQTTMWNAALLWAYGGHLLSRGGQLVVPSLTLVAWFGIFIFICIFYFIFALKSHILPREERLRIFFFFTLGSKQWHCQILKVQKPCRSKYVLWTQKWEWKVTLNSIKIKKGWTHSSNWKEPTMMCNHFVTVCILCNDT